MIEGEIFLRLPEDWREGCKESELFSTSVKGFFVGVFPFLMDGFPNLFIVFKPFFARDAKDEIGWIGFPICNWREWLGAEREGGR